MVVSKTTNSGTTWTRYTLAGTGWTYALAVDPSNSNIVYAGGNPGLFKTTNSGTNWSNISSGITGFIYALAIDPSATNTIYAGTPNGVFKSTNAGTSWINTGCTDVNAILIDPNGPDTIYAGTDAGVFRSTIGGGSWTAMNQGLDELAVNCLGIYPANYLYAGTNGCGIYRWNLDVGIEEYFLKNNKGSGIHATPNPFTTKTDIYYTLPRETTVTIVIYDVQGRLVRNLCTGKQAPGAYSISWNGCDNNAHAVPAGVYLYKLCNEATECLGKLILLK